MVHSDRIVTAHGALESALSSTISKSVVADTDTDTNIDTNIDTAADLTFCSRQRHTRLRAGLSLSHHGYRARCSCGSIHHCARQA